MLRQTAAMALICLSLHGCGAACKRASIASPYPLDRVRAAVACAAAGDADAIDLLIELLADQDRGVRMYSILALKRLCGEDYGYRYYASDADRAPAIARWRAARLRGEVTLRTEGESVLEEHAELFVAPAERGSATP